MKWNIENCLHWAMIPSERHNGVQIVSMLKQLRDRWIAGDQSVVDEFFDTVRFNDNQCQDDWRKVGDR